MIWPILDPWGRNQYIISFVFWFKWEQENLLLKFTAFRKLRTQKNYWNSKRGPFKSGKSFPIWQTQTFFTAQHNAKCANSPSLKICNPHYSKTMHNCKLFSNFDLPHFYLTGFSKAVVHTKVLRSTTNPLLKVPLSDWLERKKVPAIIIKQQFGFAIRTT